MGRGARFPPEETEMRLPEGSGRIPGWWRLALIASLVLAVLVAIYGRESVVRGFGLRMLEEVASPQGIGETGSGRD